jgi:hypothetical protein
MGLPDEPCQPFNSFATSSARLLNEANVRTVDSGSHLSSLLLTGVHYVFQHLNEREFEDLFVPRSAHQHYSLVVVQCAS